MGSLVCMSEPSWSAAIFRSPVFQVQEPRCGFISQRRLNMQGEQTSLRVVIADDHQIVRIGLRMMLQMGEGIELIGEAGYWIEAIRPVGERQPGLGLTALRMPAMPGLGA